eukprot:355370-Chlamydomonas_euryale.AAC.4
MNAVVSAAAFHCGLRGACAAMDSRAAIRGASGPKRSEGRRKGGGGDKRQETGLRARGQVLQAERVLGSRPPLFLFLSQSRRFLQAFLPAAQFLPRFFLLRERERGSARQQHIKQRME